MTNKQFSFFRINSNPPYPLTSNGNHITYSEVTIEEVNNGFTVYKYKNYDNGYADKIPLGYCTHILSTNTTGTSGIIEYWKEDEGMSMELERGQLLAKEFYNVQKKLVKKITYKYRDDDGRFDDHVKYYRYVPNAFNISGYNSYRVSAGLHYTYYPYLKEKIETEYLENGNIIHTENYTYDGRFLKTYTTKNSNGEMYTKEILYTRDKYNEPEASPIYSAMLGKSMHYPIEQIIKVDSQMISKEIHGYSNNLSLSSNLSANIYPHEIKKEFADGTVVKNKVIKKYDKYSNPVEIEDHSGLVTTTIWSYKGSHPTIVVQNASLSEVQGIIPLETINNILDSNPTDSYITTIANLLRDRLPDAFVASYTYKPLVGITSETTPDKKTTYYEYDSLGRLVETYILVNGQKNILEAYEYNYGSM